jgi:hypothetical protein
MTMTEVLTVAAIVSGPILAVQAQKWLEVLREKRDRKKRIFEILMTTRGNPLPPDHVQALNRIQLEFSAKKPRENDVIKAWRVYFDHLNSGRFDGADKQKWAIWEEKRAELFVELLEKMAKSVGYDFDKVFLKKEWYAPQAYSDVENEKSRLRAGALAVLEGIRPLQVRIDPTIQMQPSVSGEHLPSEDETVE